MTKKTSLRDRLLSDMAAHVLRNGLADATLRPLARAAGTSDRMLIYHFGTKDALVAALLVHLAKDFEGLLATSTPGGTFASVDDAVARLSAAQMHPDFADYIRLWLEIVAAAGRGSEAHRQTGAAILSGLASWLEQRLPEADRPATWDAIVRIEGTMVLWSLGLDARLPSDRSAHRRTGNE